MNRQSITINDKLTVVNNDCLDELRRLPPQSVDVVVTSCPYNIGVEYNTYSDDLPHQKYLEWVEQWSLEICRVLKADGSFFLNIGNPCSNLTVTEQVCIRLTKNLFVLQNSIVWVKNISIRDSSFGHFKPINSDRFLNHCWENIFHFTKNGTVKLDRLAVGVPYTHKSNVSRWKGKKEDRRCAGDCWFIPYKTVTDTKEHPASYPLELPLRCIKLHGVTQNTVVVDPFLGSGTTLRACQILGIHGLGIELDPIYFLISADRLLQKDREKSCEHVDTQSVEV